MRAVASLAALLACWTAPALAGEPARPVLDASRIDAVIARSSFSGDVAGTNVAGGSVYRHRGALPEQPRNAADRELWRWASVTKQVVAVLVMQEVAAGRIALDEPVSRYLPGFRSPNAGRITVRQLLQHRSGLPNPSAGAPENEMPAFYRQGFAGSRDPLTGFCAGQPLGEPGGQWSYNNCDYILLGALLEQVTGTSWADLVQQRIARPLGLTTLAAYPTGRWTRWGKVAGQREPDFDPATYGASAGLYGSAEDMLAFSVGLMNGRLLPQPALATLWEGDPALGYMALGQWVFTAPLAGCAAPVRIVERRGAVGGVQVRNFIAPDQKVALVALSDQGEFDFGEIWQGRGFSHDLLSAALCPARGRQRQ